MTAAGTMTRSAAETSVKADGKNGRSSRENEPNGVAYGATSDTHLVIDSRERKRDDVIA